MLSSEVISAITLSENNAAASAQAAAQSATNSELDSKMSQSYAVGKSGIRDGEDTDNSKYYSEQAKNYADKAQEIVGSNFITQAEKGVEGGVAVLNDNLAVAKAVADEDGNNIQNTYAKKTEISEAIEVDSKLSTTSTNPVQNKIVTNAINSASQQAGKANGILTQWQEQGRIPNGIANNLVTTEEGYALDARQLNKSVENSFAYEIDKSISAINNNLNYSVARVGFNTNTISLGVRYPQMTAALVSAKCFTTVKDTTSGLWFVTFLETFNYPVIHEIYKGSDLDMTPDIVSGDHFNMNFSCRYGSVFVGVIYLM